MQTLWGIPDSIGTICKGFHYVTTPSHGGYVMSKALAEKLLPQNMLNRGFIGAYSNNYYHWEEDCAYAVIDYFMFTNLEDKTKELRDAWFNWLKKHQNEPMQTFEYARGTLLAFYPEYVTE